MAVDFLHVPVAQAEARRHVVRQRKVDRPVIRHPVVVPEEHQFAQPQVPGQRDHLLPDTLLQAAITDQGVGGVVHQVRPQPPVQERLGQRHPRGVGNALPERPGGYLDAAVGVVFRMSLARRTKLTEAADILERDRLVAAEMQQRIEQHRTMAVRHHETVAVEPPRVLRVEPQMQGEQRGRDVGRPKRGAGMALAGMLDRIHGEETDGVGHHALVDMGHGNVSLTVTIAAGNRWRSRAPRRSAAAPAPARPGMAKCAAEQRRG